MESPQETADGTMVYFGVVCHTADDLAFVVDAAHRHGRQVVIFAPDHREFGDDRERAAEATGKDVLAHPRMCDRAVPRDGDSLLSSPLITELEERGLDVPVSSPGSGSRYEALVATFGN